MQRDVEYEKKCLLDHEHDNFPCGAVRTDHRFCTHRKFRTNEEMHQLSDDAILPGEILTSLIKVLPSKCCRGVYHHGKEGLANIFRVHGEGIALYSGTQDGDPEFGWDMQDRVNGFPCIALQADGKCGYEEQGKPHACKLFPVSREVLGRSMSAPITVCSYTFDENSKRSGECDGCKGLLGL